MMQFRKVFTLLLTFITFGTAQQWPLHSNNLTDLVQWDRYSFLVHGERVFIWSSEVHYWRMPVPEVWTDVLEKVKAAGFNGITVYVHWGFHSAAPDALDFETGAHDFSKLFTEAKRIGLYVIWRPGPYINAESTGGGFPGWLLTGDYGSTRNNDTRYTEAWSPFWTRMAEAVSPHMITNGGNLILYQIENEYGQQWLDPSARTPNYTAINYMELLEASASKGGINIPTFHNNPNFYTKSWSLDYDVAKVGGDTNIYGLDHYPSCWSCDLSVCTSTNGAPPEFTTFDYYTNFQETAPTMPSFLAEFQGGSYNPWGGPQGGCVDNTGPDWVNVYYRNNIGNKVSAMSVYMAYGGTNWGGLPMPTVGTSYDYSAPIHEDRTIGSKYSETKVFGFVVRTLSHGGLLKVERNGNGTSNYTGNPSVFAQELKNVDTNTTFYVIKHANTTLETSETFKLKVNTTIGEMKIPQYGSRSVLNGREAKIMVTDFKAGGLSVAYSTAEMLALSVQDGKPVVMFWLPEGESGEIYIQGVRHASVVKRDGISNLQNHKSKNGIVISYIQGTGMSVLTFDNGARALLVDRATAYATWVPPTVTDPNVGLDQTLLVIGPYLVRSASLQNGVVALTGDFNGTTQLEIFAPSTQSDGYAYGRGRQAKVTFNGRQVAVQPTRYGSLIGTLRDTQHTTSSVQASIPALGQWKVADSLPECQAQYDDSGAAWVAADDMKTLNPSKPATYPVLYSDQYGFHQQNILWRGRFSSKSTNGITGVYLNVVHGTSGGWSAWLNGAFLGSTLGDTALNQTNSTLQFPSGSLKIGENVLLVLQDHMGHEQTTAVLDPRGIQNATLISSSGTTKFTSWRVAGNAGGQKNIDPTRGSLNEGGLYAERLGWHLPGFDDSAWKSGSPDAAKAPAGVRFYRTEVALDTPADHDVSLAFILDAPIGSKLRAQLYVNGYMFGKFVPHIGNQIEFPVFPGILNYNGNNTVGLSVWSQSEGHASVSVSMKALGVYSSAFNAKFNGEYLRPGWSSERLQYA